MNYSKNIEILSVDESLYFNHRFGERSFLDIMRKRDDRFSLVSNTPNAVKDIYKINAL